MAKLLVVVVPVTMVLLAIVFAAYLTRRRRDKKLLRINPMALEKKGLDREALLQLTARQKEAEALQERLGNITELLEEALTDHVVTIWGPSTRSKVERALAAAQKNKTEE